MLTALGCRCPRAAHRSRAAGSCGAPVAPRRRPVRAARRPGAWWRRLTAAGARRRALAYEALRVEAHRPRLGPRDRRPHHPARGGLDRHRRAPEKGCYRGQETVARVHNMGKPPRRLVLLHLDGSEERAARPRRRRCAWTGATVGRVGTRRAAPRAGPDGAGAGEALGAGGRGAAPRAPTPRPASTRRRPPPRRPPPAAGPPRSACAGADPRRSSIPVTRQRHTSGATSHIGRRARYGRWQDTDEMRTGPPSNPAAPSLL